MRPVAWLLLLISACAVGPDYQRPALDLPEQFRDGKQAEAESAALWPWWTIFGDQDLQALLRAALSEGYDLRIAIARVEQARQQLLQARAGFFPAFNYGAFAGHGKNAFLLGTPAPTGTSADFFALSANASWEIDIWGRVRRLNEAARAQYLASQDARRDVTVSIVAEVAQNYFQLVALDRQLAIAIESRNSFAESLDIFNERLAGGVASKLETSSAAALLDTAAASRRTCCASWWAETLGPSPGARPALTRVAPPFPRACPRFCSNAGRTFAAPSSSCAPPTPKSASPKRISSRV
jgi:multidrug efflux system outer membrane protein